MDIGAIRQALIEVIEMIQATTFQKPVPLTGQTRPIKDLPGFNSKVWPVAISILSRKLAIPIPPHLNIFADQISKKNLSIDEVTGLLEQLCTPAVSV